jgi:hypothetical protein
MGNGLKKNRAHLFKAVVFSRDIELQNRIADLSGKYI